jgi:hypothetical protein
MRLYLTAFVLIINLLSLYGAADTTVIVRKEAFAVRTEVSPKVDGKLDDAVWQKAPVINGFQQNSPTEGAPVSFDTDVRILYDNTAIYISAMLYDSSPDSIMRQLGIRDNWVNADNFRMVFDTYNTQQDAFDFSVTASGVQNDSRFSDYNYNAVWASEVQILSNGWSVEVEIPWSALRFPTENGREWGVQFTRNIRRFQEFDQWALTPKAASNAMMYWGKLKGLADIDVPLRLQLTPYASLIWQNDDRFGETSPVLNYAGGMDVKYGINESFTLDMTLLPDFSQVQSDNVIKNLGAFEQQFQEQRPFFTEGVDLFQLGDLFYSRRIGKRPSGFWNAPYVLDSAEVLKKNPTQSRLMNATKISGRTNTGMGIGILNAFVEDTYAEALDTLTGEKRKLLTEPRSNYNIVVFQKQMKNSSSAYFINTNVIRSRGWHSANVTGVGTVLNDKKQNWQLRFDGAVSDILSPVDSLRGEFDARLGYQYNLQLARTSGKIQYYIARNVKSRNFDANDLGITFETNYAQQNAGITYFIFNPWKRINQGNFGFNSGYQYNLITKERNALFISFNSWFQFRNFSNMFFGMETNPYDQRDYYEPREQGRFFLRRRMINMWGGYNTNSNKKISGGVNMYCGTTDKITETIPANPWIGGGFWMDWRVNDRLTLSLFPSVHNDIGDRGWVNTESNGNIVFGRRILRNIENGLSASYVFKRDMSLTINGRHFWATGRYTGYYTLNSEGILEDYAGYTGNHNFSFNSFNVDMVFRWIFAPGSILSVGWKQNILTDEVGIPQINYNYTYNLRNTLQAPQLNQFSVRVLYFIDYVYIKKALQRK